MTSYTGLNILNAFSEDFRTQNAIPNELKVLLEVLNITVNIIEKEGVGGSAKGHTITIPKDTGPGIIPTNSFETYTTFHQYDKDSALIHELGHVILHELDMDSVLIHELNNAILAVAVREAISQIGEGLSADQLKIELKKILGVDYLETKKPLMIFFH